MIMSDITFGLGSGNDARTQGKMNYKWIWFRFMWINKFFHILLLVI